MTIKLSKLEAAVDAMNESIQVERDTGEFARCNRALREAAPTLLAIAKATLKHESAVDAFMASAARDDRPVFERYRREMEMAHDELVAALREVSP